MKIYWTDFANSQLKNIFEFYNHNVNKKAAKTIVIEIVKKTETLKSFPNLGSKEILLEDRKENFKKIIYKNYKIIYWINITKNRIEIADIFDVRQNPIKMIDKSSQ